MVFAALEELGLTRVARATNLWPGAVQKWKNNGRLPRSELAGLTHYATTIEDLSGGKYRREDLMAATRAAWLEDYRKHGRPKRAAAELATTEAGG